MTPEQLLVKRVQVSKLGYPNCLFKKGEILTRYEHPNTIWVGQTAKHPVFYRDQTGKHEISESTVNQYPHLFRRLNWWEFRKLRDMPEYLKMGNVIYPVKYHDPNDLSVCTALDDFGGYLYLTAEPLEPATLDEFQFYQNSLPSF
jgi:hypothetical protein